jgi:RNA polymerase sigma factor for flagellar operon FliA
MEHLEPSVLAETWSLFKWSGRHYAPVGPMIEEHAEWVGGRERQALERFHVECRNSLILHYSSLVRYVAAKVGGSLPAMVDRDDLVSYGMFGLMDAIEKFNIDHGVKFETYGVARIRGAIYDEIRALDWVPRSVRSKARDIEKARAEIEMAMGRPAEHTEVAQNLGLSLDEYWVLVSQANAPSSSVDSLDMGRINMESGSYEQGQYESTPIDGMSNPADLIGSNEIVELVGEAINNMDERSKTILVLYYLQEMTLAEIGQILGVTESRVCQLQSKVLLALRESLGQGGLAAA